MTTTKPTLLIAAHYASAAVARAQVVDVTDTPVWEDVSTGLVGSVRWMTSDPASSGRYFCVTTDGLYRAENLPTAPVPLWVKVHGVSNVVSAGQAYGFHWVVMSAHKPGWIAVCNLDYHTEVTFDYGATWHVPLLGAAGTNRLYLTQVQPSPYNTETNGVVWFRSQNALLKSTDWGLTFPTSVALSGSEFGKGAINLPLFKSPDVPNDPAGLQTIYVCRASNGSLPSPSNPTQGTSDSGSSWVTPIMGTSAGASNWGNWPSPSMRSLQTYTQDGQIIMAVQRTNGIPPSLRTVMSANGGTSAWPTVTAPTAYTNIDIANVNGWPYDPNTWICWGVRDVSGPDTGFLSATNDAGVVWHDLLGNLISGGIFADAQIAYAEFSLAAVQ